MTAAVTASRLWPESTESWPATLLLEYALRDGRSSLVQRAHRGPLLVQKPFYPEGEGVCHSVLVHPPGGIAGGDCLTVEARIGPRTRALLTTPGANKWYRSSGRWARQALRFGVSEGASLEWLPQETIVFDGALAALDTRVELESDGLYIGWEITCLGRTASGERFARGALRQSTEIWLEGKQLWGEYGSLKGSDPKLSSPVGMRGEPVIATLLAAGRSLPPDAASGCQALTAQRGQLAVTGIPSVLAARYLGPSVQEAKRCFVALWSMLRPVLAHRIACAPRIWNT